MQKLGLDSTTATCYYDRARLVSALRGPAFWQSMTLGEEVIRKGGFFFWASGAGICASFFTGHFLPASAGKPASAAAFGSGLTIRKKSTGNCPLLENRSRPPTREQRRRICPMHPASQPHLTNPNEKFRYPRPTQQNLCYFVAFSGDK